METLTLRFDLQATMGSFCQYKKHDRQETFDLSL
jgi:hypothetical protein